MSKKILAIKGGPKVRRRKFPPYLPIGTDELNNVKAVFKTATFSRFLGCWHEDFFGGNQVQMLEKEWATFFDIKHAICVNSATSGLYCAVGAIGTEPFDEIIVSPYTMAASATAPLVYGAIPVFADVEPDYFCMDVKSIEEKITSRTKAIIIVDIFGQAYSQKINDLAKRHNLRIIEDCAQAPYAKRNSKFAGTLGDIGIYSLNYHKHIHCGEGGVIVTNSDELANRVRLIRNHAEAVIEAKGESNLVNMVGFNYRMTEIEAAIARAQLKKLEYLIEARLENIRYLEQRLSDINCLKMPKVRKDCTHVYYQHALLFDDKKAGISRNQFVDALRAELMPIKLRETEGISIGCGYVKPLYLQPMFQKKIAFGSKGYPWSTSGKIYTYPKGLCPVTEDLHYRKLFTHEYMRPGMTKEDLDDVIMAFHKVWEHRHEIG